MTTREHLRNVHEKQAQHHVKMGKIHSAALKKSAAMEDGEGEAFHGAAMAEHSTMAEYHLQCCKDLSASMKAAGMTRDEIMPDFISSIAPEMSHTLRMIPRTGQREFSAGEIEIAAGLEKVLGDD